MVKLFPKYKREDLQEYASNTALEPYTSIVLDKDTNEFKVVTGYFHDKRDAYERLKKRGLILRKTFERDIWDWIEENAPNNLTAYLMFSTAVSKWQGNNILNDYYVKLLNDIPKLNREKEKGDPNTMGGYQKSEEAVINKGTLNMNKKDLQEVSKDKLHYDPDMIKNMLSTGKKQTEKDKANAAKFRAAYDILRDVHVKPINQDGTYSKYAGPLKWNNVGAEKVYKEVLAKKINGRYQILDPAFLRDLYEKVFISHMGQPFPKWACYPKFDILDNSENSYAIITKTELPQLLEKALATQEKEIAASNTISDDLPADHDTINNLKQMILKAKIHNDSEAEKRMTALLADTKALNNKDPRSNLDAATLNALNTAHKELASLQNFGLGREGNSDPKAAAKVIRMAADNAKTTLDNANEFSKVLDDYKDLQSTKDYLKYISDEVESFDDLLSRSTRNKIITMIKELQKRKGIINNRGISSISAKQAKNRLSQLTPEERQLKQNNFYNSTATAPKNTIHGGDMLDPFISKFDKKNKKVDEAAVNTGVKATYLTQPKAPVMNKGTIIPYAGRFVEGEDKFNPELFDGDKLKTDVRKALIKIAKKFYEKLDTELVPVDIYLTGSNANYNYNKASDIDLHLVYNYEDAGGAAEIFKKYLFAQKKIFNSDYDIYVKGIKVEVGAEDINNPLVAGGVYSLLDNTWKVKPDQIPETDNALPPYINEVITEIEEAIQSHDADKIGNLWKALGELRRNSLAEEGEFGSGNLMFKKLRADGYLDRLKQAYYDSESDELSLESLEEI